MAAPCVVPTAAATAQQRAPALPAAPRLAPQPGPLATSPTEPRLDEACLAAQLGLDVETYRMLRQLEEREIEPEDYELLGRLDDSVRPVTLSHEEVESFPTAKYGGAAAAAQGTAPVASRAAGGVATADFAVDFWRLPMPLCESDDEEEAGCSGCSCCFGLDFWRLPEPTMKDDNE